MIYNPDSLNLKVISYSDNEALCICPFHHDTKPSASFNLETGLFYCFACGTAHSIKSLASALDGEIEKINTYVSSKAQFSDEKLWLKLLWNNLAYDNDYLKKRNVSNEMVNIFSIRENEYGVIFPLTKDNKPIGVQIRRYNKYPKYLTFGKKPAIWPTHVPLQDRSLDDVMIVEGIFSVLNLYRMGINAYATLGAIMKPEVKDYVRQSHVLGFFDNDFAGYVAGARLLSFIPRAKIIVPGDEVDEFSNANLIEAVYNREHTRQIPYLARLSGDENKFYNYVPKG